MLVNGKGLSLPLVLIFIFILLVITTSGYILWKAERTSPFPPDDTRGIIQRPNASTHLPDMPSNGAHISESGKWKKFEFPNDYVHSVDIYYPSDWEVNCCGDTDSYSAHSFSPKVNGATKTTITVYDYSLLICANGKESCGLEGTRAAKPAEFFSNKVKQLDPSDEPTQSVESSVIFEMKNDINLAGSTIPVKVYTGGTLTKKPIEVYLMQLKSGVVQIHVEYPELINEDLKKEFLNRIVDASFDT